MYLPHADASDRENRAYQREMEKARGGPRYTYTDLQLRRAYEKYKKYLSNQNMMRSHNYESEMITDAFNKMPNLKTIEMSMEYCLGSPSTKIERAFGKGLALPYGDDRQKELCGILQLRSLLLAVANANLKLESLCCGNVHWRFLKHSPGIFEKMQRAVQFLHHMTQHITTRTEEDDNDIPQCYQFLDNYGRLRDLITAAPDLKHLEINFDDDNPFLPTSLKDVVGDFKWHALRSAIFSMIDTDEGALVNFYGRHADTLRGIGLENIRLEVGGVWPRLLQCMRKMLRLEKVRIGGRFSTADGASYLLECLEDDGIRSRTRVVIEDYLLAGGEGRLLDLDILVNGGWSEDE